MKASPLYHMFWMCCLTVLISLPGGAQTVTVEQVDFQGWPNSYRMSNGEVELVVVADIGPRILHFGFTDGENVLSVAEETAGKTGGNEWHGYGGHRLWVAPEIDMTYYPDNDPVRVSISDHEGTVSGKKISLSSAPELIDPSLREQYSVDDIWDKFENDPSFRSSMTIKKHTDILMGETGIVEVSHTVVNVGNTPLTLAPWALTVMKQNGVAIVPAVPYAPHGPGNWLPKRTISLWSYTDLTDERLHLGKEYYTLKQDPEATTPFKIGFSDTRGMAAYVVGETMFLKMMEQNPQETYPDMGTTVELFTNAGILEVESLGPLKELSPGESIDHAEQWSLHRVPKDATSNLDEVVHFMK